MQKYSKNDLTQQKKKIFFKATAIFDYFRPTAQHVGFGMAISCRFCVIIKSKILTTGKIN